MMSSSTMADEILACFQSREKAMSRLNFALMLLTLFLGLHHIAAAQSQVKPENQRTGTVSGRVILNGEPLGGVTIQIFPERMLAAGDPRMPLKTVADEQGRYRITGIIAGSYHISVLPNEFLITGGLPSDMQRRMLSVTDG